MSKLRNNNGITLMQLVLYMILLLFIIGLLATIRGNFEDNLTTIQEGARYAAEFDKFNSYFTSDVKSHSEAKIGENSENMRTITFDDGVVYTRNTADRGIYRTDETGKKIKIASNIETFNVQTKDLLVNSCKKQIITVEIVISKNSKQSFKQIIDYTLNYWQ